jgi:IS605 OrfB family transposase
MIRTYQGRLRGISQKQTVALDSYGTMYGHAERTMCAALLRGEDVDKPAFSRTFGLTARQFNAIKITLGGKLKSLREIQKTRVIDIEERTRSLKKKLDKLTPGSKRHQLTRKLERVRHKLTALKADKGKGKLQICFGSRKLFHAQYHLKEGGYASHEAWRRDWVDARSNEFFVIGSKDETAGCQGCQIRSLGEGRFTLKLRLPDGIVARSRAREKYVTFETTIPHGSAALERSLDAGTAISFRFLRDKKGWRVLVSTDVAGGARVSFTPGAIGVDMNAGHLAVSEVDKCGNPVGVRTIPLVTYGCTTDQANAKIGDAVKQVVAMAVAAGKPLVVEELDFQKKKRALREGSPAHARMLSSFAYSRTLDLLHARAADAGIEVIEVNPAYTSVIGRNKFARRYGLSTHGGAGVVIARRALSLSERPTSSQRYHDTSPAPVWKRGEHVWKYWARVHRLERRLQRPSGRPVGRPRGHKPSSSSGPDLSVAGATPAREPSALFGGRNSETYKTLCF